MKAGRTPPMPVPFQSTMIRNPVNWRDWKHNQLLQSTPASINRHTGKPHEHKREIARNLRGRANG